MQKPGIYCPLFPKLPSGGAPAVRGEASAGGNGLPLKKMRRSGRTARFGRTGGGRKGSAEKSFFKKKRNLLIIMK